MCGRSAERRAARDEMRVPLHQALGADPREGARHRGDCCGGMETRAVAGDGWCLLSVAAALLVSGTGCRRRLAGGGIAGDRASHGQGREREETPCGRHREDASHRTLQPAARRSHSSALSACAVSFQVHAYGTSARRPRPPWVSPRAPLAQAPLRGDAPLLPILPSEPFARRRKSAADGGRT